MKALIWIIIGIVVLAFIAAIYHFTTIGIIWVAGSLFHVDWSQKYWAVMVGWILASMLLGGGAKAVSK